MCSGEQVERGLMIVGAHTKLLEVVVEEMEESIKTQDMAPMAVHSAGIPTPAPTENEFMGVEAEDEE